MDGTFCISRTSSAQAPWQEGPWLPLLSPGIQRPLSPLNIKVTTPPSTVQWMFSLDCGSLGMVEMVADTPCLVRKEGLFATSSLGFPDCSVRQSVGLSPTGLELGLWEPRRLCISSMQELGLPWFANWHRVGAYWMLVNCGILLVTWRLTVHKKY